MWFLTPYFIGSFCTTLFAHLIAWYLVKVPLIPKIKNPFKKLRMPMWSLISEYGYICNYIQWVSGSIFSFFLYFFYTIAPTLTIEQTCAYTLFYFTLAITIITDYYTYLISTLVTLYLLPAVFFYAFKGYLSITLYQSISSALLFGILAHLLNLIYIKRKNMHAIGEGDRDLLMYIASFVGCVATFEIIFYASVIGCIWGLSILLFKKNISLKSYVLPFGTCLGLGAFIHFFINFWHGPFFLRFLH